MTECLFSQPVATPVVVHIVETHDDWPKAALKISSFLKAKQDGADLFPSIDAPDNSSASCPSFMAAANAYQRLCAQIDDENRLPFLGRDPRTTILGPLAPQILRGCIPGAQIHFASLYARAVYPWMNQDPGILLLPALSRATAFLTVPISLVEPMQSVARRNYDKAEVSSGTLSSDSTSTSPRQGNDSTSDESTSHDTSEASDDTSEAIMIQPEDHRHTFSEVHLLWPLRSHSHVPLALLCVAEGDEIYSVLSSALMQRHTLGIHDALPAIVFDPDGCTLQLVIGWIEEGPTHPYVHVAHAKPLRIRDHGLGLFDISDPMSAQAFGAFLVSIGQELEACAQVAKDHAVSTLRSLLTPQYRRWRVDLAREVLSTTDDHARVARWVEQQSKDSTSTLPPEHAKKSRSNKSASTRFTDEVLRDQMLHKVEEKKKSASLAAKSSSNILNRATEIFVDRAVFFSTYPPWFVKHELAVGSESNRPAASDDRYRFSRVRTMLQRLNTMLFLPLLCEVLPLPQSENKRRVCESGVDTDQKVFTSTTLEPTVYSASDIESWAAHHEELALEQAIRCFTSSPLLEELIKTERDYLVDQIPYVLRVTGEVEQGANITEADSRHAWDAIAAAFMRKRTGTYNTYHRLERRTPFSRNRLFDAVIKVPPTANSIMPFIYFRSYFTDTHTQYFKTYVPPVPSSNYGENDDQRVKTIRKHAAEILQRHVQIHHKQFEERNSSLFGLPTLLYNRDGNLEAATEELYARALSDFPFSNCDAVDFVEIPGVFQISTADKNEMKKEIDFIKKFIVVGERVAVDANGQKDDTGASTNDDTKGTGDAHPSPALLPQVRALKGVLDKAVPEHRASVTPPSQKQLTSSTSLNTTPAPSLTIQAPKHQPSPLSVEAVITVTPQDNDDEKTDSVVNNPSDKTSESIPLCLPIIYYEYKRGSVTPQQGLNQARFYILSATDFYAALDMFNVVVFALATVGTKGRLICGWAEKNEMTEVEHYIVDTNCPEYNLTDRSDVIRFCVFLLLLRERYVPDVVAKFEARAAMFREKWKAKSSDLEWTIDHQQQTEKWLEIQGQWNEQVKGLGVAEEAAEKAAAEKAEAEKAEAEKVEKKAGKKPKAAAEKAEAKKGGKKLKRTTASTSADASAAGSGQQ